MKADTRTGLGLVFFAMFTSVALAQSGIITTYVGPPQPINGVQATTQAIDPMSVVPDEAGGFYVSSSILGHIYRVDSGGNLTRIAGSLPGYGGDGGPALSAQLRHPGGIARDSVGNLYMADTSNQRVRKVTPAGVISTVAGNGIAGFSGDGGPATAAALKLTSHLYGYGGGLAIDSANNLYIADSRNSRVRKVTPSGIISTVAGNGTWGFAGDGGQATSAELDYPQGVAVDDLGTIYIADTENRRIRKVTPSGIISTVAGDGTSGFSGDGGLATDAQLSYPVAVALDGPGNLLITDYNNGGIRRVSPAGLITSMVGDGTRGFSGDGGPATAARTSSTTAVAVDSSGNYYLADEGNRRIRRITPAGIISSVAGNGTFGFAGDGGPSTAAMIYNPGGLILDTAGNLYISDSNNNRIRKITPSGIISTVAGNGERAFGGDGGLATAAKLRDPVDVALDGLGNLYICDSVNSRIRRVTPSGIISTVAGNGIYGFSGDGGAATSAQLSYPRGIALDASGTLYISDRHRVRKVTPAGIISTVAGNGTGGFSGDGGPATSALLNQPAGLKVDASGNLLIADANNFRIRKVTPGGIISTVAGNGTFGSDGDGGPAIDARVYPDALSMDSAGSLYITDRYPNFPRYRIRKVTTAGIITSVAGDGWGGFGGDGGAANGAQLSGPFDFSSGVAVDAGNRLYIADSANHRIRRVEPPSATPTWVITMSKSTYVNGDTITVTQFGPKNPSSLVAEVHIRVTMSIPTLGTMTLIDTTISLPANLDVNLGPLSLVPVSESWPPKGTWSFDATLTNPTTSAVISQDLNPFTVQ